MSLIECIGLEGDSCPVFQFSSHFGGGDPNYLGPCAQHQLTWSPSTLGATSTVRELEGLYRTLRQQQHQRAGRPRRSSTSNGALSFGAGLPSYPSWRLGEFLRNVPMSSLDSVSNAYPFACAGSSDGYRCSLSKTPSLRAGAHRCRCSSGRGQCPTASAGAGSGAGQVGVYVTASTPPFDNMPSSKRPLPLLARLGSTTSANSGTSAFRTPLPDHAPPASTVVDVPQSPLFLTPTEGDASATVLSVDDETTTSVTSSETPAVWAPKPARKKKKRFVVTRAEDVESLLPRDPV